MDSNDDIDEAEQLRLLALQSMVKRSIKKKKNETDDKDDQDIMLLRAAALKTITRKNNQQNNSLNTNNTFLQYDLKNDKKRNINNQVSSSRNKKSKNQNENKSCNLTNHSSQNTKPSVSSKNLEYGPNKINKNTLKDNNESQQKPDNKVHTKKIVRNGCIQLSNLNSENIDETMILQITFSSSESDDSSSDVGGVLKNDVSKQKNNEDCDNNDLIESTSKNIKDNTNTNDPNYLDSNFKMNNCMQKVCELMRNCESEIEKRDEQVKLLLDAYEKYQNHSTNLYSILKSLKTVRDELAMYESLRTKTTNE